MTQIDGGQQGHNRQHDRQFILARVLQDLKKQNLRYLWRLTLSRYMYICVYIYINMRQNTNGSSNDLASRLMQAGVSDEPKAW